MAREPDPVVIEAGSQLSFFQGVEELAFLDQLVVIGISMVPPNKKALDWGPPINLFIAFDYRISD
jgi:hypothetical protein